MADLSKQIQEAVRDLELLQNNLLILQGRIRDLQEKKQQVMADYTKATEQQHTISSGESRAVDEANRETEKAQRAYDDARKIAESYVLKQNEKYAELQKQQEKLRHAQLKLNQSQDRSQTTLAGKKTQHDNAIRNLETQMKQEENNYRATDAKVRTLSDRLKRLQDELRREQTKKAT